MITGLSKESLQKIEELRRVNVIVEFTFTGRFYVCTVESEEILIMVPSFSKQFSFSEAYARYLEEIIKGKEEKNKNEFSRYDGKAYA